VIDSVAALPALFLSLTQTVYPRAVDDLAATVAESVPSVVPPNGAALFDEPSPKRTEAVEAAVAAVFAAATVIVQVAVVVEAEPAPHAVPDV
jgi:hypothetical protein